MSTLACPACSATLRDFVLSCPECGQLTHSARLEELAGKARESWRLGDFRSERSLWAESVGLLPEDTVQHRSIRARIAELDQLTAPPAARKKDSTGKTTSLGIGSALLVLLSKWKLLLLGFTKLGTLVTMAASVGVYWSLFGWPLAVGLVLSIYIHEMGHVIAIRGYGLRASAPMFIPGLGALIRLQAGKLPPIPDARIGLAGPVYGLGAAVAAEVLFLITHAKIFGVIAHLGAVINLFNLIPIWQLDGSRGMHSLTRQHRALILAIAVVLWWFTNEPMLLLIAGVSGYRLFTKDWTEEPDLRGLSYFAGLLFALAVLTTIAPAK